MPLSVSNIFFSSGLTFQNFCRPTRFWVWILPRNIFSFSTQGQALVPLSKHLQQTKGWRPLPKFSVGSWQHFALSQPCFFHQSIFKERLGPTANFEIQSGVKCHPGWTSQKGFPVSFKKTLWSCPNIGRKPTWVERWSKRSNLVFEDNSNNFHWFFNRLFHLRV